MYKNENISNITLFLFFNVINVSNVFVHGPLLNVTTLLYV